MINNMSANEYYAVLKIFQPGFCFSGAKRLLLLDPL